MDEIHIIYDINGIISIDDIHNINGIYVTSIISNILSMGNININNIIDTINAIVAGIDDIIASIKLLPMTNIIGHKHL